jgi:hypothetical protein
VHYVRGEIVGGWLHHSPDADAQLLPVFLTCATVRGTRDHAQFPELHAALHVRRNHSPSLWWQILRLRDVPSLGRFSCGPRPASPGRCELGFSYLLRRVVLRVNDDRPTAAERRLRHWRHSTGSALQPRNLERPNHSKRSAVALLRGLRKSPAIIPGVGAVYHYQCTSAVDVSVATERDRAHAIAFFATPQSCMLLWYACVRD